MRFAARRYVPPSGRKRERTPARPRSVTGGPSMTELVYDWLRRSWARLRRRSRDRRDEYGEPWMSAFANQPVDVVADPPVVAARVVAPVAPAAERAVTVDTATDNAA